MAAKSLQANIEIKASNNSPAKYATIMDHFLFKMQQVLTIEPVNFEF